MVWKLDMCLRWARVGISRDLFVNLPDPSQKDKKKEEEEEEGEEEAEQGPRRDNQTKSFRRKGECWSSTSLLTHTYCSSLFVSL